MCRGNIIDVCRTTLFEGKHNTHKFPIRDFAPAGTAGDFVILTKDASKRGTGKEDSTRTVFSCDGWFFPQVKICTSDAWRSADVASAVALRSVYATIMSAKLTIFIGYPRASPLFFTTLVYIF